MDAASLFRCSPGSAYIVASPAIAGDTNGIEVIGIVVDVIDLN